MTTALEESSGSSPETALRPVLPQVRMQIQLDELLSDDEFWDFCQQNKKLLIEQNSDGTIVLMPPTGGTSGSRNAHLIRYLGQWAEEDGTGIVSDSSTMFRLPSGAKRMPDASLGREKTVPCTQ